VGLLFNTRLCSGSRAHRMCYRRQMVSLGVIQCSLIRESTGFCVNGYLLISPQTSKCPGTVYRDGAIRYCPPGDDSIIRKNRTAVCCFATIIVSSCGLFYTELHDRLDSAMHLQLLPRGTPLVLTNNNLVFRLTRAIPKVSGLDILDNNIFYNLYISETYILYKL